MGRVFSVKAEVKVDDQLVASKTWSQIDVMKTGQVRGWLRRAFNTALKTSPRDVVVFASFYGQLSEEPYTSQSGSLAGVNGRLIKARGVLDA